MASDKSVRVEVKGLAELGRAFKQVDVELPNALKAALKGIAEGVAGVARGKVPHKSGDAAGSIVARSTTRGAGIAFGGSKAPYLPWLNFGGTTGKGHQRGPGQGSIHRDSPKPDRYIYSAIHEAREETAKEVEAAIIGVARSEGFEVH